MFVVIVEFVIHREDSERFVDRVRQQARDSLEKEADCHVFDVCIDPERPDRIVLYELYSDDHAFKVHLQSAHFKAFDLDVGPMVKEKSVQTLTKVS